MAAQSPFKPNGPVPGEVTARPSDELRVMETLKEPLLLPPPVIDAVMESTAPDGMPLDSSLNTTLPMVDTVPDPEARKIGDVVGRYRLVQRLGKTSWNETWKATREGAASFVSLQRALTGADRALVEGWLAESRGVGKLRHPNVLHVIECADGDGESFVVNEFVAGRDLEIVLRRALKRGFAHLPAPVACFIAAEVLAGLGVAHQQGMVHSELTPQTLWVGFDGRARVFDFGAHRQLARKAPLGGPPVSLWSYFSPEHIRGETLGGSSDAFVVGMILFRMLCGQFPFPGRPQEVVPAILEGRFPTPVAVNPQLSDELSNLLTRALEPALDDRFDSAAALEVAVRAQLARIGAGFDSATLGAFMLWLFEEDLEKEGILARVTAEQKATFELWAKETQKVNLSGDTFKPMDVKTALESVPDAPPRMAWMTWVPWVLAAAGVGAAAWFFLR